MPAIGHATEIAPPSDAMAELVGKRSAYSTSWRTRDGGTVTRIESAPSRWRDVAGKWRDYDFALRVGADGGYAASIGATAETELPARLDGSGDGGALLSTEAGSVQMWLEGAAGNGTARDEVVTYRDALPGVTVKLRASTNGLKEDLVLADASAASRFSYRLRLTEGLRARLTAAGTVAIGDGATVRFEIPRPVAADAGEVPVAAPVPSYRLRALDDGDYRLSFAVDRDWLDAPERVWPVTVDPTIGVITRYPNSTVRGSPQPSTCINRMVVTAVSSPQQTVVRSTVCNDPNGANARIGAERTMRNGATYSYTEVNATLAFPTVEEALLSAESLDSATLTLWKEADAEYGGMTGFRVLGKTGVYNDDPASTVRTGYQVPGWSFDVDVKPIVSAWAANLEDPARGFPQQPLTLTEDAESSFWFQGASWPGVEYCYLWLMSSTCPRWGSWIGTSTSPIESKRPVLELRTSVLDVPPPRLAIDTARSWAGQVFVINTGDTWFEPDRITLGSDTGGLRWATGGATADGCTGVAMAPGRACWIRVTGDGTARFADGRQSALLTVNTSGLPSTPPSGAGPHGPWLEASVSGDVATIANAGPTASATISQVSFASGDVAWRSSQSDDLCTGATLLLNDGSCELRLRGTSGVVRFTLDGGIQRDLAITLNPPTDLEAPTLTVSKPAVDLTAGGAVTLAPPSQVVAGGSFAFSTAASDERQIHAVTVRIDGRAIGTFTGATYRGCAIGSAYACLPVCSLFLDGSTTSCADWYWGDRVRSLSRRLVLDTTRYTDGRHLVSVTVQDGAGIPSQPVHSVTREWEITVDNDGPAALVSGSLLDQRGRDRLLGPLTLRANADAAREGGVTRMRLVDETSAGTRAIADQSRTCSERCDVTTAVATFDLTAASWSEGAHRLRLEITGASGRTAVAQAWTVDYYGAARRYGGLDGQADFAQVAADLWSRSDRATIWNSLRQADKNVVLVELRGRLVRESDESQPYYVGLDGRRHQVGNASWFGLQTGQILVLPDGALSPLPRGPGIAAGTRLYRSTGDSVTYYMSAATLKRHRLRPSAVPAGGGLGFQAMSAFGGLAETAAAWDLDLATTEPTPSGFLTLVTLGTDITPAQGGGAIPHPRPADGTMVRDYNGSAIYYVSGGARHWVSSLMFFGLSQGMVRLVPDGTVALLPAGPDVPTSGFLFRGSDDPAVYYVYAGIRYWIPSAQVAAIFGLDLSTTALLPPGMIGLLPRGPDVPPEGIPGVLEPLDVTDPSITLGGPLNAGAGRMIWSSSQQLDIAATDAGRGVYWVAVAVNGNTVYSDSQGCPQGGCSMNRSWVMRPDSYGPGPHVVTVTASDWQGRIGSKSITVDVNPADDACGNGGNCGGDEPASIAAARAVEVAWDNQDADVSLFVWNERGATATPSAPSSIAGGSVSIRRLDNVSSFSSDGNGAIKIGLCYRTGRGPANVEVRFRDTPADNQTVTLSAPGATALPATTDPAFSASAAVVDWQGCASAGAGSLDGVVPMAVSLRALREGAAAAALAKPAPATIGGTEIVPTLTADGDWNADATGASAAVIGMDPRDGFTIGTMSEPVNVVPVGTATEASDATLINSAAAVYGNTGPSTDTVVRAAPTGVTTVTQMRALGAPEVFEWQVTTGQTLQQLADGGIAVLAPEPVPYMSNPADDPALAAAHAATDGRAVAVVEPPQAFDAGGAPITAELAIVGATKVRLTVPRQSATSQTATLRWRGFVVNRAELDYCKQVKNIERCTKAFTAGYLAHREMLSHYPRAAEHGRGDAFRHCYWSATMSRHLGRGYAKRFGDLHEAHRPRSVSFPDRHNNSWGREWYSWGYGLGWAADMCLQDSQVGGFLEFGNYS